MKLGKWRSIVSDNIKDRLYKILALAENGIAGEKETAKLLLTSLLEKHNLTLEDIGAAVKKVTVVLKYGTVMERKLACQIMWVVGGRDKVVYTCKQTWNAECECTSEQAVEMELMYDLHKRAMEASAPRFLSCLSKC